MDDIEYALTMTPAEASEILRKCGFSIGYDKLIAGLRMGNVFPFGVAIQVNPLVDKWSYIVYRQDLYNFIRSHGGVPPQDEFFIWTQDVQMSPLVQQ